MPEPRDRLAGPSLAGDEGYDVVRALQTVEHRRYALHRAAFACSGKGRHRSGQASTHVGSSAGRDARREGRCLCAMICMKDEAQIDDLGFQLGQRPFEEAAEQVCRKVQLRIWRRDLPRVAHRLMGDDDGGKSGDQRPFGSGTASAEGRQAGPQCRIERKMGERGRQRDLIVGKTSIVEESFLEGLIFVSGRPFSFQEQVGHPLEGFSRQIGDGVTAVRHDATGFIDVRNGRLFEEDIRQAIAKAFLFVLYQDLLLTKIVTSRGK